MTESRQSFATTNRPRGGQLQPTSAALSLEGLDRAIIEEAKAVILGKSRWFSFDDAGVLHMLNPHESMDREYLSRREMKEMLEAVTANPKHYEELLANVKENGLPRPDVEAMKARKVRLEQEADTLRGAGEQDAWKRLQADTLYDEVFALEGRIEQLEQKHPERVAAEIARLEGIIAQVPFVLEYDKKLVELREAMQTPPTTKDGRDHVFDNARRLEAAAYAFPDTYERIAVLENILAPLAGTLGPLEHAVGLTASRDYWERDGDQRNQTLTPKRKELFRAVVALLGKSVRASDTLQAREQFNQQVQLTVRSNDTPLLQDLHDDTGGYQTLLGKPEVGMNILQETLTRFRQVISGNVEPTAEEIYENESQINMGGVDQYNPTTLLHAAMTDARALRRNLDDYMRFHNSHPEAVNFIRASPEAEFLLSPYGQKKQVEDAASFVASPWMLMAGGVEFKVDPELLQQTRETLQGAARAVH